MERSNGPGADAWPDRGETVFLQASTPTSSMQPPPPRPPRLQSAGKPHEEWTLNFAATQPQQTQQQQIAHLGDLTPASPSSLLQPPRKRTRVRPLELQQLQQPHHPQAGAAGQPLMQVSSPYASAPLALFVSDSGFGSPHDPLSPVGGRVRRSSAMSSATIVACLPPISPLNLGGFEQQFVDPSSARQQQQQAAARPGGRPGLGLSLDVDAVNSAPGASGGALTPHLGDLLTPGQLMLGSPVDLGDGGLGRAVDVAAELGLVGTPGGPDVCGLLASPDHILTSPRGAMLASLRDVVLASPLGKHGIFSGGGMMGFGAHGGHGGLADAAKVGTALSPLATPLFAGSGQQRQSWARRESRARSSLLSASTPQPELSAWVPCSTGSGGGGGGGAAAGAAGGAATEVQPPWLSSAGHQQQLQFGVFGRTVEVQRGTSKGASYRPLGRRGSRGEQQHRYHRGSVVAEAAALQQQQDGSHHQQYDQQRRGWDCAGAGAGGGSGCVAVVPRPWNGLHGVPASILKELPQKAKPGHVMLDSIARVWECAGRRLPN